MTSAQTRSAPPGVLRGRYAPSPSGRLHLGNVRTALLSWLQVRAAGGEFVMRVEDVDTGRSRPEHEQSQLADLRWLGIDWDEGPDVGGPYGPYRQSERGASYVDAVSKLQTFACSCTRRELREAAGGDGVEPIYPGACREGPRDPSRPLALRWIPPARIVVARDALCGSRREDLVHDAGNFILRRTDGDWAYALAVVLDDGAMRITDVLRGEDLWTATPRQIALHEALGQTVPRFVHVPLLRGADGRKLSKRHGAPDLTALREGGADPQRVVAWLARSVGLVGEGVAAVSARALVADFEVAAIQARQAPPWPDL